MTAIADRVAKGVGLLDSHCPDWRENLDLEILDIESLGECVLAQVFSSWSHGTHSLGITEDRHAQTEHGFDLSIDEYYGEDREDLFFELNNEWRKQIKATSK